jgi:tryptophan-rich sensory protein
MAGSNQQRLGLLARLVVAVLALLVIAGAVWHGVTVATVKRIWFQELARPSGPMKFRFVLQPLMAAFLAIRDGIKDARTGRAPFFWAMLYRPGRRVERLEEGLNATARVILLGLVMDVIYQYIVLQRFYPAEAVIIAIVLAFLPYAIIRGPVARIARERRSGKGQGA